MTNLSFIAGLRAFLLTHVKSERGATAVEYALLVALIAGVIATAIIVFQGNVSGAFNKAGTDIG